MADSRRRLIFLWMYLEWGGAQIYFLAIIKQAVAEWDVTVILPRDSARDIVGYVRHTGAQLEFLESSLDVGPAPTLRRKLHRHISRFKAERESLKHLRKYDLKDCVLHVETAPWQSWQFLTLLLLRGAHVFVTLHNALPNAAGWREFIWRARMRFLSRFAGFHIFASNHDTKNKFRTFVTDRFWKTIPVTYTCVNPIEIEAAVKVDMDIAALRSRFGIQGSLVVFCAGQFIDRKGRWVFLDAAKKVSDKRADISFVWLSPTMPSAVDQQKIETYGLGERFKLITAASLGRDRADILRFYRLADVFALASFVEGLPISLLEAMALKLPSISTNISAIPEAVYHGENGILIPPGDANALTEAIILLATNPELRDRLSEKGSRDVLAKFDERAASRIALDHYTACFHDG
ncbi:MAG: glycosyltransferase family 4 protein [Pyrinomonadaceae bacterium]